MKQGARGAARASMLSFMPGGAAREADLDQRVAAELPALLALRMVRERAVAELGHVGLAAVVLALLWGTIPIWAQAVWMGAVMIAALARLNARQLFDSTKVPPRRQLQILRRRIFAVGLAWGLGFALLAPQLEFAQMALLFVAFSGLISVGTITLAADPRSFYGLAGGVIVPLVIGLLRVADSRAHAFMLIFVALFTGIVVSLFRRNHAELVEALRISKRLELSEAEVARERGFLDALISSAPTAIVAVSRQGTILGVNPSFEEMFGWRTPELVGRTLDELIVPPEALEEARRLEARVAQGEAIRAETIRRRRDGQLIEVRIAAAPVAGIAEGGVFVLYDDITAMKRAERARREAEAEYRQLVEAASDLVWRVDAAGCWTFVNPACEEIYGCRAEELLGRPFAELVHADHRDADLEAFQTVLAGQPLIDHETVHLDARGEARTLSFTASPLRDADGAVVGAHGTARDVTARVAVRETLREARDVAERAAAMKSSFLANMSHEIRTPLNGVLGMLELLLNTDLTGEQRRSAELARGSASALLHVINDVLDFSKIEAGHLELERTPFELHGLLDATARLFSARATERGVELALDIEESVPDRVVGDPGRLRQVLTNLISNAVKFTEHGTVTVHVAAPATPAGADEIRVRIAVRDTGIGVPPAKLEAIFEEFAQADASTTRKYGGTGLGLAISRRLVDLMGGRLAVDSAEGRGSEFWFEVALGRALGAAPPPPDLAALAGARVLVVDDNAVNRQIFRRVLTEAGADVDEAPEAESAFAAMDAGAGAGRPFALVVLDGQMPGQDGFMLAARVRETFTRQPPALMLCTSGGMPGDGRRCRELGIDAYLVKPVARTELLETAARLLSGAARTGDLVTRHTIEETRRHVRVLVAEDNPVNQEVVRAMLRKRGHAVTVVATGRAAVEAMSDGGHDVILMDIQMPEMDGLTATRAIRALPTGKTIPIVALTAHALAGERDRCLEAGMNDYLSKPFKSEDLFQVVERWGAPADRVAPA